MSAFDYTLDPPPAATLGLVVLQSDETIEQDFRRIIPADVPLYVSRVPSATEVTRDSLQQMEAHLPSAARLFPEPVKFDIVGYGCTSGTAQIGAERISTLVKEGCETSQVTEPVSALVAACNKLNIRKLAILSPYIETVSAQLRLVLADRGIDTRVFGSFDEAEEAKVAHISAGSVLSAARELVGKGELDGLFLSCTNLRTLDVIGLLENEIGMPVLSSNQVLAWHMAELSGIAIKTKKIGKLFD